MKTEIIPPYISSFELSLAWILRSVAYNDGNGSSAYYHLWKGWSGPYAETTGYLIPTLWQVDEIFPEKQLGKTVLGLAEWLLSIQRVDGSFPQGLELGDQPEIFDSGQILFGLYATWEKTQDIKYKKSIQSLTNWMLAQQCENGAFCKNTYVKNYSPSYHIRFVWALLLVKEIYAAPVELNTKVQKAMHYYSALLTESGSFKNWGFHPETNGLTHTIAYTLRGFLECSILMHDNDSLSIVLKSIEKLVKEIKSKPYLAGSYDQHWHGDNNFRCLTGEAQMSIVFRRLAILLNEPEYHLYADRVLEDINSKQIKIQWATNLNGGFFASSPFYGKYMRFMMNNWTAKFYLDAVMIKSNPHMVILG
ncbi:MAG: hypothetical protein IPL08_17465 [Saprospiraceae bacterium]|nr:hypothetical protein [Saprospiraceae bacterium]